MKLLKLGIISLIAFSILFSSLSCSGATVTTASITRTAAVQRGDISVSITGIGNLAYSKTEELAFEIAGYVEDVLVSKGDMVKAGDEIARLNTSDWENDIKKLTNALSNSQRSLTSAQEKVTKAQRALVSAQTAVTKAQRTVTAREMAVQSAELDLQNLEYNLNEMDGIKEAADNADSLKTKLDVAEAIHTNGDYTITPSHLALLKAEYDAAEAKVEDIKKGADASVSTSDALQIAKAVLNIEQSKRDIEDANIAVENAKKAVDDARLNEDDARKTVSDAQLDVADAQQNIVDAQAALDENKSLSPIVKAPFDGYITDVKVIGGDDVKKGSVAAVIADPKQFEAKILVTENDIFSVKVGGEAAVSLDALSGVSYPAKIASISPTAKVSSGVVNYYVTVELTSLKPVSSFFASPRFPAGSGSFGGMPSGTPPSGGLTGTPPAGGSGMQGTPPAMPQSGTRGMFRGPNGSSSTESKTPTLKEGLSATVKITTEQVADVLVIPSRAITTKNKEKTVQVINGEDTETRVVTVGMSDGTNTEVSSGLSEGEQVSYKVNSSSGTANNQRSMGIGIGGGAPVRIR
jgi:HlyD family secretion protein